MSSPTPQASVIVPTRNRKDLLRGMIASCLAQSVPVEIIVVDDGSTDGTDQMVRDEFPQARYQRFEGPNGPCFLRNRGSEMASTEFLFPFDDDVALSSPHTIEQTLRDFSDDRIAAVGIPYINTRIETFVRQQPRDRESIWVSETFVGAAHAIRRSRFLQVGGYREFLFYMGEEGDLTLRLLARGSVTRIGTADPILHFESPIRDRTRSGLYGRRNDILTTWLNTPLVRLPDRLISVTFNGLRHSIKKRRPFLGIRGLAWGYASVPRHLRERDPVSPAVYGLYRRLCRGSLTLDEIRAELPPLK